MGYICARAVEISSSVKGCPNFSFISFETLRLNQLRQNPMMLGKGGDGEHFCKIGTKLLLYISIIIHPFSIFIIDSPDFILLSWWSFRVKEFGIFITSSSKSARDCCFQHIFFLISILSISFSTIFIFLLFSTWYVFCLKTSSLLTKFSSFFFFPSNFL